MGRKVGGGRLCCIHFDKDEPAWRQSEPNGAFLRGVKRGFQFSTLIFSFSIFLIATAAAAAAAAAVVTTVAAGSGGGGGGGRSFLFFSFSFFFCTCYLERIKVTREILSSSLSTLTFPEILHQSLPLISDSITLF